jgi:phytoene/squalene synthetase
MRCFWPPESSVAYRWRLEELDDGGPLARVTHVVPEEPDRPADDLEHCVTWIE